MVSVIQSQKYLECTFDQGDFPCKFIPFGTAPELQSISLIMIDNPAVKPSMPLSDVTSITVPTLGNNLSCQIPYQLDDDSENLYFCSKSRGSTTPASCLTADSSIQECMLGQYVLAQLAVEENHTYFIEVQGTTRPSCLSFYYYISNPNVGQIIIRYSDIIASTMEQIGTASNVSFNGWHEIHFTFKANVTDYRIYFDLQRLEHTDKLVFIALDEIKIVYGRCESDIVDTTTTTSNYTTQMITQEIVTTTTIATTIAILTTEETTILPSSTLITSTKTTIYWSSETWIDSTSPTITHVPTTTSPLTTSVPIVTSSTTSNVPTTTSPVTSTVETTTSSMTTVRSTTSRTSFRPLFQCDFSTACFGKNVIRITDGTEFNSIGLTVSSEPPRVPSSDVTSITTPTNNNQLCAIPYQPQLENSTTTTSWNMWFCYKNQCPVPNGQTAICASGSYGLISLDSSNISRTIIDPLMSNTAMRDVSGDQCLRFYYYFTLYEGKNWGQQIQLWIRPNNQSDSRRSIGNLTVDDMKENRWKIRTSVDNLNYLDVKDQLPQTTTAVPLTITTTKGPGATPPPTENRPKWGLVLGLSVGIGIPAVLLATGGVLFYLKRRKDAHKLDFIEMDGSFCDDASETDTISLSSAF
ncbi:hypothetical protein I4U23_020460 [Adineta vaga]|nr:hypothetical protein I4U23_020460 [Adineta vaga]